ncbi:MAG TPA: YggS family pyridoxal phosphate-dependent enzyme [Pyrinomonadaceae bacterium]|nr:YggS family pyridoxal phosphate-dependent enzyme [Pyrinomonadaceae bacterium]
MQHAGEETATSPLAARIEKIRRGIATAAARANRSAEDVTLVAVSKTHPAGKVREAIAAGQVDFGENRVQEAETKIPEVGRDAARWHLIGHLQSNKARRAVELFDWIHSVDSADLARRIDRICDEVNREELPVLIQVDLGHEATKTGVAESGLREVVEAVRACDRLRLMGLMTLPPFFDTAEKARPYFQRLRELRDELQKEGVFGERPGDLSMGMTHDFEIAIEEGATIIRVGTAIFGERHV